MESYLCKQGKNFHIIEDIGSGLNYKKNGLNKLLEMISSNKIDILFVLHKDRLVRFGFELIEKFCNLHGTYVHIINNDENKSLESELVDDILNIIHVFSCRLNGRRSAINKKIIEKLSEEDK